MMTDDQRRLAADNHNLIYKVLNDQGLPIEDYYDVAAIGLCKAAMTYKDECSRFSTYAYSCIKNEFRILWQLESYPKRKINKSLVSYNALIDDDCEWLETLAADCTPVEDVAVNIVLVQQITARLKLKPRDVEILWLLAIGYNQREIAERYGVTRQAIDQILRRIRRRVADGRRFNY